MSSGNGLDDFEFGHCVGFTLHSVSVEPFRPGNANRSAPADRLGHRADGQGGDAPGLDETELYRKAIRSWFLEKRGGTHGAIADDLDDTWL